MFLIGLLSLLSFLTSISQTSRLSGTRHIIMAQVDSLPAVKFKLYEAKLSSIPPNFSTLLSQYSKVPPDSQIKHVVSLRNRAYESHPYPCLGRFRFMDLDLSNHPLYQDVLKQLKSSDADELFLDFGCCIGQDIRKLLLDGAPASKVYGSDLLPAFIDTGYELFRDEATFPRSHFTAPADGFDASADNALAKFDGQVTVLHISAVFHLFGLEKQRPLARRVLQLLRHGKKCLVLGAQTANVKAGEHARADGSLRWRHSGESWAELWEEAAREFGGCRVEAHSKLSERKINRAARSDPDQEGNGSVSQERSEAIGYYEKGFRWMVFWTWVEFEN
jgi:SAM-dependent methyltransferase